MTPAQVDLIAEQALEDFGVPGMAVAVIQPSQPAMTRGYGRRVYDQAGEVGAQTLFGIGSISKAFTTAALAQLVEQGKLSWDDRVVDHLPEFRMNDPWVTRQFQVRDLVTHRSGLPPYAGDLVILSEEKANREAIYRALANFPAASSFRTEFAYDNLLYVVAGDLLERLSGLSWGDYVARHLLEPLGMSDCEPSVERVPDGAERAAAHDLADGKLSVVDFPLPPVTEAAGGIFCNASGMARWVRFNLGVSGADAADVLSRDSVEELWRPVTPIPVAPHLRTYGGSSFSAYGLGWFVSDSYGTLNAQHGGGLPGMVSYLSLYPEAGLGVMVMTNRSSGAARAVAMQIAEQAFTEQPRDIIAALAQGPAGAGEAVVGEDAGVESAAAPRPALPLARYAGRYTDAWFGDVDVRVVDGALHMDLGSADLTGVLEPVDGDRFIARWANRGLRADAYVMFRVNGAGDVVGAAMEAESSHTDPSFDFHDLDLEKVPADAS
nr:serine hydrolase [Parahaliea mediterranea]